MNRNPVKNDFGKVKNVLSTWVKQAYFTIQTGSSKWVQTERSTDVYFLGQLLAYLTLSAHFW